MTSKLLQQQLLLLSTLRHVEKRRKWGESLAMLQSNSAWEVLKQPPQHATCSGSNGWIPISSSTLQMNSLLCDNTPTERLQRVMYSASLHGNCGITQRLDPPSNSLSSGRKVNVYKNNANEMPFYTKMPCPHLTVPPHARQQFTKCMSAMQGLQSNAYMSTIPQTEPLMPGVK